MSKFESNFKREEILQILESDLGRKDFQLKDYLVKAASDSLLGFLGEHMKIKATVSVEGEEKTRHYFVKKIPTEVPLHLEYARKTRAFYKEIELYRTYFKDLENAQKDAPSVKWRPEFYYSRGEDIFVVEDLCVQGYYMYPERTLMDLEHCKASMKAMAIMHAASYIFEEKFNQGKASTVLEFKRSGDQRVSIGQLYEHLTFETEASDEKGHPGNTFYEAGLKASVSLVELLPGYSEEEKQIIRQKLPNQMRKMFEQVKPSSKYKNIMIHGDLWSNNMMFKKTGDDIHGIVIDYQLARYAPPAHELVMFLYLVQNQSFRAQHEEELLRLYHDTLHAELARHDLTPDQVDLSWATLRRSYEDYHEYGVVTSAFYFQLTWQPGEINTEFFASPEQFHQNMAVDRSELVKVSYIRDELCRNRLNEAMDAVIKDFILKPKSG